MTKADTIYLLSSTAVDLLLQLSKLASDVGSVTVENGRVSGTDLSGMVHDDDLSVERARLFGGILLRVGTDGATTNVLRKFKFMGVITLTLKTVYYSIIYLHGDVLDVEANIVSRHSLGQRLVMHLDRLDLSSDVLRSERDDHSGLDDSGLNSTDRDSSDTCNQAALKHSELPNNQSHSTLMKQI